MKQKYHSKLIEIAKKIAEEMDQQEYDAISKEEKLHTDAINWFSHHIGLSKKGERKFIVTKNT